MDNKSSGDARFSATRSAFVVHSDMERPKVKKTERRPVIMKHRTQRRRTCRIAKRPARDVWKHELYEAKGRQRKSKMRDPQAKDDGAEKTYLSPR